MTKYIKLDDMINLAKSWEGIKISNQTVCVTWGLVENIELLPTNTIPEPYKGTNWDLLQGYIDKFSDDHPSKILLQKIQSRLVSDMPKIGEKYAFSNNSKDWLISKLKGISYDTETMSWNYIRPISPIPPEISSAIKLLEDSNYIVTKK